MCIYIYIYVLHILGLYKQLRVAPLELSVGRTQARAVGAVWIKEAKRDTLRRGRHANNGIDNKITRYANNN